jgi:hypothetical protein
MRFRSIQESEYPSTGVARCLNAGSHEGSFFRGRGQVGLRASGFLHTYFGEEPF